METKELMLAHIRKYEDIHDNPALMRDLYLIGKRAKISVKERDKIIQELLQSESKIKKT